MTWRTLLTILSACVGAVGIVGLSETIHPSKTALEASSLAVRLFGPVFLAVAAGLFAAGRALPKKATPGPASLALLGLLAMLFPGLIWLAGAVLAPEDGARWAPMVAVGTFLVAMPGFGMFFGGLRRLRQPEPQQTTRRPSEGRRVRTRR